MTKVQIEGQNWNVESVKVDGAKVTATLAGGQQITVRGKNAETLLAAFKLDSKPKGKT